MGDNGTYRVIREPDERHIEDLLKLLLHHESFSLEAMNRINYTDHTPLDIILRAYLKEATYSMAKQLPNNHLRFEETTGGFHYSRFHIPFSRKAFLDNIILLLHSKGAKGNKYQAKLDKLLEAEKARKQKEEAERIARKIKEEAERILKKKQELEKKEAERKRKEEERRRKKYLHACKIGDIDHIKTHRQFYRQYHYGMTGYQSLMLAVQNQRIKVVKYLLDNGGNVSLSL